MILVKQIMIQWGVTVMNIGLPADATTEDAALWLRELVREFGLGFHPDDRPEDYVRSDGTESFTASECELLTESLDRLFEILGDERPYEICAAEASVMMAESMGLKPSLEFHDPDFQQRLLRSNSRVQ